MPEIECPSCQTRYEVPLSSLPEGGRKVRCTACKALWFATPGSVIDAVEPPSDTAITGNADAAMPETGLVVRHETGDIASDAGTTPSRQGSRPWHHRLPVPKQKASPRLSWQAGAAAGIALMVGLGLGIRERIVTLVPESGRIYAALGLPVNLTGLEFRGTRSALFAEDKIELLVVQGEIVNVSQARQMLPRLKFSVRDAKGAELYAWTAQADAKDLDPGVSIPFRRRLASPPPEGVEVLVRFATPADLVTLASSGRPGER